MTSGHLQYVIRITRVTGSMAKVTFSMSSGSQSNWLDDKGLTDTHLQYIIRLASNGLMAKE